jgi:hypothetical protein
VRKLIVIAAVIAAVLAAASARAEQKNVQLLTNMTDLQLQRTMNFMRASLGVHCDYCHVVDDKTGWDFASDAKPEKKTGREMIRMVLDINSKNFPGRPQVTCNTCHRGQIHPVGLPELPQAAPPFPTPAEESRKGYPEPKELLAKYVAAIGGEPAMKKLAATTRVEKGTLEKGTNPAVPIEIYTSGDHFFVSSVGSSGKKVEQALTAAGDWSRNKDGVQPMRPSDAEVVRGNAIAFAPFEPKLPDKALTFSKTKLGDHETWEVAGQLDDKTRERLYFDTASGLLVRRVITRVSPIGRIPEQTDYDDYRDVGGVKVPFSVRLSLVDPWSSSIRKYSSIELGVPVDEKMFEMPK